MPFLETISVLPPVVIDLPKPEHLRDKTRELLGRCTCTYHVNVTIARPAGSALSVNEGCVRVFV